MVGCTGLSLKRIVADMTICASVLAHSIFPGGKPLVTFELYYPRAILHEELLTHRAISKSSSSSRATPIQSMIDQVRADPALPSRWGINGKGMQDHGEMTPADAAECKRIFLAARDDAIKHVGSLMKRNPAPHKQIANLFLRPWEHITVVSTATDWANFFALRRHKDAKPEFQELANAMWEALQASTPRTLGPGEWHLPYIYQHELDSLTVTLPAKREEALANLIRVSAARCARTSYKNHRGKTSSFAEDVDLYNRLASGEPMHASPLEHQATPDTFQVIFEKGKGAKKVWDQPELHGNFSTWIQHRKTIPGENITVYKPES